PRSNYFTQLIVDLLAQTAHLFFFTRRTRQEQRRLRSVNAEAVERILSESDSTEHWLNLRYTPNHRILPRPNPPPYIADSTTPILQTLGAFPEDIVNWEHLPDYVDTRHWTRFEELAPYLVFNQQTVLFDGVANPGYHDRLHLFLAELHVANQVRQRLIEYEVLPQQFYDFNRFLTGDYPTINDHRASYLQVREWQRERVLRLGSYTDHFNYDTFAPYESGDPLDVDSVFPDQNPRTEPWPAYYLFLRLISTYGDVGSFTDPYGFTDDEEVGQLSQGLTLQYIPVPPRRLPTPEFVPGRVTYDSDFADAEDNASSHSSDLEFELFEEHARLPDGSYPDWIQFPSRYDSVFREIREYRWEEPSVAFEQELYAAWFHLNLPDRFFQYELLFAEIRESRAESPAEP
ncbi:hypothetical protein BV22DRAFT_1135840, partial [Leucogyrophana mollusca]